jgi:hypothetical protein|nr:MAG TPA: hypothetical protein [Caudoviricetes sp.]
MGLGGVLAAMAQGLGTSVIKNVEQGWKNEELDKTLNWREKEADKQRAFDSEQLDKKLKHDFEIEDHKSRNNISEAAAIARIKARYARASGGGGDGMKEAQKNLTGAVQVLGVYDAQLGALRDKLASTEDPAQRDIIAKQMDNLSNERSNYLKSPSVISAFKGGEQMGRALYVTSGGDMDLYDPKPIEAAKEVKETVSSIAAPARNMVDVNSISPQQADQIARQKREEISRQNFARASEEAKEWAAKQNQYKSTMFTPRTF